jgi:hypothetical protein
MCKLYFYAILRYKCSSAIRMLLVYSLFIIFLLSSKGYVIDCIESVCTWTIICWNMIHAISPNRRMVDKSCFMIYRNKSQCDYRPLTITSCNTSVLVVNILLKHNVKRILPWLLINQLGMTKWWTKALQALGIGGATFLRRNKMFVPFISL